MISLPNLTHANNTANNNPPNKPDAANMASLFPNKKLKIKGANYLLCDQNFRQTNKKGKEAGINNLIESYYGVDDFCKLFISEWQQIFIANDNKKAAR